MGQQDPFASIAKPVQNDPFAAIAKPVAAAPADTRNGIQKAVDAASAPDSPETRAARISSEGPVLGRISNAANAFGSGASQMLFQPLAHPIDAAAGLANGIAHSSPWSGVADPDNPLTKMIQSTVGDFHDNGAAEALPRLGGQVAGGIAAGELGGQLVRAAAPIIKAAGSTARTMAIGDPDAAALHGLKIPAGSGKVQPMQNSVQAARPYLQGVNSLEDLQARIPQAKDEIWSPYQETIDKAGNHPVNGPDGPTTLSALEQERLQLSALNRGLKAGDPNALQLAQQKGMNQADLLDREKAVTSALDPELSKFGIDPQAIRGNFGAVSRIGNQISGKSTLLEKPQPFGIGKMLDIRLDNPKSWLGKPVEGVRDLIAGRPLFSGSPTDVGISEGFRSAGPKPDLGSFTPPQSQKLLGSSIPGIPHESPFVKQPIVTPPPSQTAFRLPSSASDGETQPMLGIKANIPQSVSDDFSRTRVVPSGGELRRMGGTVLPPETKGLALPSGADLLRLPSSAGAGETQPMIGISNNYPDLATDFARERVPPNVFSQAQPINNKLFYADSNGQIVPERLGLPAPKPKAKK